MKRLLLLLASNTALFAGEPTMDKLDSTPLMIAMLALILFISFTYLIKSWLWINNWVNFMNRVNDFFLFPSFEISFMEWLFSKNPEYAIKGWRRDKVETWNAYSHKDIDFDGLSNFLLINTLQSTMRLCEDKISNLSVVEQRIYYSAIMGKLDHDEVKRMLTGLSTTVNGNNLLPNPVNKVKKIVYTPNDDVLMFTDDTSGRVIDKDNTTKNFKVA